MSIPNNIIQPQNIVINQVPLTHAIMTNVNATNGIPIATAIQPATVDQNSEIKTGIVMESIPITTNLVGVQTVQVANPNSIKPMQVNNSMQMADNSQVCSPMAKLIISGYYIFINLFIIILDSDKDSYGRSCKRNRPKYIHGRRRRRTYLDLR